LSRHGARDRVDRLNRAGHVEPAGPEGVIGEAVARCQEQVSDPVVRQVTVPRHGQRRGPCRDGRREGRATRRRRRVAGTGQVAGSEDRLAWGRQVDQPTPCRRVVGERGPGVRRGGRRNAEHPVGRPVVTDRAARRRRQVRAVIARSGHQQNACVVRRGDGGVERRCVVASKAQVDDLEPRRRGILDPRNDIAGDALAIRAQRPDRADLGLPARTRDAERVVADRRDAAHHAGSVSGAAVHIPRGVVVVNEVPAVHVIDVSVAVVVDAVAGHLAGVDPAVGVQIGVVGIHAAVNDGDGHSACRPVVPRGGRADQGQPPLARVVGVVGRRHAAHDHVRAGQSHLREALVELHGGFDRHARRRPDGLHAAPGDLLEHRRADSLVATHQRSAGAAPEDDEDLALGALHAASGLRGGGEGRPEWLRRPARLLPRDRAKETDGEGHPDPQTGAACGRAGARGRGQASA